MRLDVAVEHPTGAVGVPADRHLLRVGPVQRRHDEPGGVLGVDRPEHPALDAGLDERLYLPDEEGVEPRHALTDGLVVGCLCFQLEHGRLELPAALGVVLRGVEDAVDEPEQTRRGVAVAAADLHGPPFDAVATDRSGGRQRLGVGVVLVRRGRPDPLGELLVEEVEKRHQEVAFAVVVVVEGGLALVRLVGDSLHRHVRVAVFTEGAVSGLHGLVCGVAHSVSVTN